MVHSTAPFCQDQGWGWSGLAGLGQVVGSTECYLFCVGAVAFRASPRLFVWTELAGCCTCQPLDKLGLWALVVGCCCPGRGTSISRREQAAMHPRAQVLCR